MLVAAFLLCSCRPQAALARARGRNHRLPSNSRRISVSMWRSRRAACAPHRAGARLQRGRPACHVLPATLRCGRACGWSDVTIAVLLVEGRTAGRETGAPSTFDTICCRRSRAEVEASRLAAQMVARTERRTKPDAAAGSVQQLVSGRAGRIGGEPTPCKASLS